ncbi:MAG: hypothetical protein EOO15_02675 [Chitinophagaceae bacterium]|nr:MAG: hypothetical protein EOO15_02675 [Chitinophagaceae bacterium]
MDKGHPTVTDDLRALLRNLYITTVALLHERTPAVEVWLELSSHLLPSDAPAESEMYLLLVSGPLRQELSEVLQVIKSDMRKKSFDTCGGDFERLQFLTFITARCLWHFKLTVPADLEYLVRNFERLDDTSAQKLFHRENQMVTGNSQLN